MYSIFCNCKCPLSYFHTLSKVTAISKLIYNQILGKCTVHCVKENYNYRRFSTAAEHRLVQSSVFSSQSICFCVLFDLPVYACIQICLCEKFVLQLQSSNGVGPWYAGDCQRPSYCHTKRPPSWLIMGVSSGCPSLLFCMEEPFVWGLKSRGMYDYCGESQFVCLCVFVCLSSVIPERQ